MSARDQLIEMLSNYPAGVRMIDTLEISHPNLSQTYYFTPDRAPLTAYLEDTITQVTFEPANIQLSLNSTKLDLDQTFVFTIADPENVLDDELDNIGYEDQVSVVYRAYVSSDLTEPAEVYNLTLIDISQSAKQFSLTCSVSQFNNKQTGEKYTFDRFPMLRALR